MLVNKSTSEAINKAIPALNKVCVFLLCRPWIDLSRFTEDHHKRDDRAKADRLKISKVLVLYFMNLIIDIKNIFALMDEMMGHGLSSTKWNIFFFIRFLI